MYTFFADTGVRMYNLLNYTGFVALVIFNLAFIKNQVTNLGRLSRFLNNRILKRESSSFLCLFAIVEILLVSIFQGAFVGIINETFGEIMQTGDNYFGTLLFGPIIMFLVFYIMGLEPFKMMDLITPAYSLGLIFVKLACFCAGCCNGKVCSWGLYYPENDTVMFPSQLLEAFVALSVFVFLMVYRKKVKEGTLFPIYLIIYSVTRFFTEFTREEDEVFGILKSYHILCIVGFLVGVIWLIIVKRYSTKIIEIYEGAPFPWKPKEDKTKKTDKKVNKYP